MNFRVIRRCLNKIASWAVDLKLVVYNYATNLYKIGYGVNTNKKGAKTLGSIVEQWHGKRFTCQTPPYLVVLYPAENKP